MRKFSRRFGWIFFATAIFPSIVFFDIDNAGLQITALSIQFIGLCLMVKYYKEVFGTKIKN